MTTCACAGNAATIGNLLGNNPQITQMDADKIKNLCLSVDLVFMIGGILQVIELAWV
jgi:hypothetical protein